MNIKPKKHNTLLFIVFGLALGVFFISAGCDEHDPTTPVEPVDPECGEFERKCQDNVIMWCPNYVWQKLKNCEGDDMICVEETATCVCEAEKKRCTNPANDRAIDTCVDGMWESTEACPPTPDDYPDDYKYDCIEPNFGEVDCLWTCPDTDTECEDPGLDDDDDDDDSDTDTDTE